MQQRTSKILYSYWNDVRGTRLAPKRFEIEPARIAPILPDTFILERLSAQSYRFRLAGTRICEQFCYELRGTDFLDLWDGEDISRVCDQLATLAQLGGVGVLQFKAETRLKSHVSFEAILLPLLHTQQTVTRYLGAMSTSDQPAWLGVERFARLRLLDHDIIWPDRHDENKAGPTQDQPLAIGQPAASRVVSINRRHFRVYDGGRADEQRDDG